MQIQKKIMLNLAIIALLLGVAGCGGSSSDTPAADTTTITGSVFAAPVSGGSVVVKDKNGNTIAGPVNTSADGTYTVNVPTSALANDMRVESSGGSYEDEATGTNTTAGTIAAYVSSESLTKTAVNLDPSSTIVHNLVTKGSKTFGEAQSLFNSALGFQPDCSIASKNTPSTGGTDAERLKAFRAGIFSQLTKDLGLTPDKQSALLSEMAEDLADDGILNGSIGVDIPEDIQNKFENAIATYLTNTTKNLTGIDTGKIGNLPMGRIALTPTYRVEYIPGMMGASVGKSSFKLKITNRTSKLSVTGLTVKLMPLMHMPTMSHTAPMDAVAEDPATPGTYNCTVYFPMASGPNMGFWSVAVMIGSGMMGESAIFHPAVGMGMGDTKKFNLSGVIDYSGTSGTTKRTYMLYHDGLISGMTSTFNLFIATTEDMMHMPGVSGGTILTSPTGTWAVDPATTGLQASFDNTFASGSVIGIDNGKGHWSLPGLSGLSTGVTSTIYVKFTVNSELKTAGTSSTAAGYATFVVTPAAMSGM